MHKFSVSTSDKAILQAQIYMPKSPQAMVLVVHGFGEHMGRYAHVADFFMQHHLACVIYDRRGHGISDGIRGHFKSLKTELDDITLMREKIAGDYPQLPIFLYGHSQGGNITLSYLLREKPTIAGSIVSAPWLELVKPLPKIWIFILSLARKFIPRLAIQVKPSSEQTCKDEDYEPDPLALSSISANALIENIQSAKWLMQYAERIDVPVLLMHGSGDFVTSYAHSEQFYRNTLKSIDFKCWEGMNHNLHREAEQAEVMAYATNWIQQHL